MRLKWTLTRREQAQYKRIAKRLKAAGAEIDSSAFETTDNPWLSVSCYAAESSVRTMCGACIFRIYLRIVALAPKVVLQDFDIASQGCPLNAYVLDDPSVENSKNEFYLMLDRTKFHRDEVLNHRVDSEGVLRRGEICEGLLLAEAFQSIEAKYTNGAIMPLQISIANSVDEVHDFTIHLRVEKIRTPIRFRTTRRGGLFDGAANSTPAWLEGKGSEIAGQRNRNYKTARADLTPPRAESGASQIGCGETEFRRIRLPP
jgi:hypothetical protein